VTFSVTLLTVEKRAETSVLVFAVRKSETNLLRHSEIKLLHVFKHEEFLQCKDLLTVENLAAKALNLANSENHSLVGKTLLKNLPLNNFNFRYTI
jgi:hypothetical protein